MKINKSLFSWILTLWLCCTLLLQSSHGIDLLINEVFHNHTEEHQHKDGQAHHDETCSICHFHLSPTLLPTFVSLELFAVSSLRIIDITYAESISRFSNEYISLRAPPAQVS